MIQKFNCRFSNPQASAWGFPYTSKKPKRTLPTLEACAHRSIMASALSQLPQAATADIFSLKEGNILGAVAEDAGGLVLF